MDLRQLVRGRLSWPRLEAVARELAVRYDRDAVHVEFLEADNWLSTPMVVDERWFVKVVSPQNTLVHALFTTGRNLGAVTSGCEGFFDRFWTPYEMAQHELEATRQMHSIGLNAPKPIEAFEIDNLGVVVLEYLPSFRSLDELDREEVVRHAPELFRALRTMHDNGLAHGDLRGENVLVYEDTIYFIDATKVQRESDARAYDLACGLAALEPLIGTKEAVRAAETAYSIDDLLEALDFLDFVNIRPDHDFDATAVKGVIETTAGQAN